MRQRVLITADEMHELFEFKKFLLMHLPAKLVIIGTSIKTELSDKHQPA